MISASAIELFAKCPAAYAYRYLDQLTLGDAYSPARAIGTATHDLIQTYLCASHTAHAAQDIQPKDMHAAQQLAVAYAAIHDKRIHIAGNARRMMETEVYVEHNGVCGSIDGVIDCGKKDGRRQLAIWELKTTSETVDHIKAWLTRGVQVPLYQHLLGIMRPDCDVIGAVIDVVKKPMKRDSDIKTGRKTKADETQEDADARVFRAYATNPDKYFLREFVPIDHAVVAHTLDRIAYAKDDIARWTERGFTPPIGKQCADQYGWCEYRSLCWYGDDDGYVTASGGSIK